MPNQAAVMCRLGGVDIISSLLEICRCLYPGFSVEQTEKLREDVLWHIRKQQPYLFIFLSAEEINVLSEYEAYTSDSEAQRYIKQLFNKKLPVILAVSVFDARAGAYGDISVVGYSRLLDRISSIKADHNHTKLLRYIERRRETWRLTFRAVTMEEFLEELREECEN